MSALTPQARLFVYRTILRPSLHSFSTSITFHTASSSSSQTTPSQSPSTEPTPTPTPTPLPQIIPTPLTRPALHRLHALSALRPPPPDSEEERVLTQELGELVGLMELVKGVEIPEGVLDKEGGVGGLLAEGVGAVVIGRPGEGEGVGEGVKREAKGKHGHELLGWSPTRTGDFYSSALPSSKST
ncbi:hypothetical protein IAT38_006494 [Cryptococcus sp. DSM 104549]